MKHKKHGRIGGKPGKNIEIKEDNREDNVKQ